MDDRKSIRTCTHMGAASVVDVSVVSLVVFQCANGLVRLAGKRVFLKN